MSFHLMCFFLASAQLRTPENVPISFYGKAIDQDGLPVVGASVHFLLVTSHIRTIDTSEKPMMLTTGADGRFSLIGVTGYALDHISIAKEGYELSQKNPHDFIFGLIPNYTPDATNPVIFQMWKQAGKENLVQSSWHGKVACDGTTNIFDLASGHPSQSGNLEIVCARDPVNLPPGNIAPFTWKFKIRIIGGGIQPTDDEFTYLAHEAGYKTELGYGQKGDEPKWDRNKLMPKEYYIKTSDGHYGQLSVTWNKSHAQSPTILEWSCFINLSGSRNLER